ncbi:MAG TPA: hypothetical protein VFW50_22175 [Streptosporangiaceae bacterium]|nr:hypothetical protein [Streptosporangiaceae bacterium]
MGRAPGYTGTPGTGSTASSARTTGPATRSSSSRGTRRWRARTPSSPARWAKESVKAAIHDPERKGLAAHGFRQKMAEVVEKLPGRDDK